MCSGLSGPISILRAPQGGGPCGLARTRRQRSPVHGIGRVGLLIVEDKQRTTVPALYAAGDVVSDLHQISVAEGHAAIAATAIHNSLPRNFRK